MSSCKTCCWGSSWCPGSCSLSPLALEPGCHPGVTHFALHGAWEWWARLGEPNSQGFWELPCMLTMTWNSLCQKQKEGKCSNLKTIVCSISSSVNNDCGDSVRTMLGDTATTEAPCTISLCNILPYIWFNALNMKMDLTLRRHKQYSFTYFSFVWAALRASFSALLTYSDNPRAINVYGSNIKKWATSSVNQYTVILELFILCVSHEKEKVKGKEVKHCQKPHWRNTGLLLSVTLILIKEFEQSSCAALGLCRVGLYCFCSTDVWHLLGSDRLIKGMRMTHFKRRKITEREVSELLGFLLFSNVPLDFMCHIFMSVL